MGPNPAQQTEQFVVGVVAGGVGLMMLLVDPQRLPDPIRTINHRLGKYRQIVAVLVIVAGIVTVLVD
jgi:hypothetical protein